MPTWMEPQLLRQPGWQSFGIDSLYRLFELQKNIGFMQREHASLYYGDYYNLLCAVLFFGRGTHAFWLFRGLKQFVLVRLLRPHTTWAAKRVAEGGKSRLVKYCTLTRFVWVTEILQEEPDWIKICDDGTGLNRLFWTFWKGKAFRFGPSLGVFFSGQTSHKKTRFVTVHDLSMKYWLFNWDPYNGWSPIYRQLGSMIPYIP